jgi:Na+-driven multidrug efflux pump
MLTAIYLWAVAGAMPSFVGQNMGAHRMDRVQEAVKIAVKFAITAGLVVLGIVMVLGPQIVARFSDDDAVRSLAVDYLRIVSVSYALSGLVTISSQTLSSLHYPMPAAVINLARTVVVTVPLAILGHWLGQIHGVFVAISASGIICGVVSWIMMSAVVNREARREAVVA